MAPRKNVLVSSKERYQRHFYFRGKLGAYTDRLLRVTEIETFQLLYRLPQR